MTTKLFFSLALLVGAYHPAYSAQPVIEEPMVVTQSDGTSKNDVMRTTIPQARREMCFAIMHRLYKNNHNFDYAKSTTTKIADLSASYYHLKCFEFE